MKERSVERMLNRNDFIETVRRDLINFLPEEMAENVTVMPMDVVKINDQKLHGLTIREEGKNAAMTFYLDDMFERYEKGADIGILMTELAAAADSNRDAVRPPEVNLSWDEVKDHLSVRLVEKQRNQEYLRERPYADVGNGLALICDVKMDHERGGDWRANVTRDLLETFGVDPQALFAEAMKSGPEIEPAILTEMSANLFGGERVNLLDDNVRSEYHEPGNMYVLTNESSTFGAGALFYPDVQEKAAEALGSGYYVLPSSLHEVILVPDTMGISEKELADMVKQANNTVVQPEEVLSDNVYHYDKASRSLEKVTTEPERNDRVAEDRWLA